MAKNRTSLIDLDDARWALKILLRNFHILLFFPLLTGVFAYIYTHRMPDVYACSAQIRLKTTERYDLGDAIDNRLRPNAFSTYEEVASEIRVMQSSDLISRALERLDLDVNYFILGRLKEMEVFEFMPFKVHHEKDDSRLNGVDFLLNIKSEEEFQLRYELNGVKVDEIYRFGDLILDNGLYLTVHKENNLNPSTVNNLQLINYMFRINSQRVLINQFKSNMSIKAEDFTHIITLNLKDRIPERASIFLDTLAQVYIEHTLDNNFRINENTVRYIEKQMDEVSKVLNDIESELQTYRDQKEIMNLDREEEKYFDRYFELEVERERVRRKIGSIEALENFIIQDQSENLLPPSFIVMDNDKQLADAVNNLYQLQVQRTDLLFSRTEENQSIGHLNQKIEAAEKNLLVMLNNQKVLATDLKGELDEEYGDYRDAIRMIPRAQRQVLNIERGLAINEELYSFLLRKRSETLIARAGIIPETKLIEPAYSLGIVEPNRRQMSVSFIIGGLIFALVVVLIKATFFDHIVSLDELKEMTSIPLLGGVPYQKDVKEHQNSLMLNGPKGGLAESFRSIRTNLQFLLPENRSKRFLVTSLLPGEGKTFTSVNLGLVLAMAQKKVLIIDMDLHKPRVADQLGLDNTKGVSSFLLGNNEFNDVIQDSGQLDFLKVVCSGPVPLNASELVMSPKVDEMLKLAEEQFDYVLIDSPPISLISDALILSMKVDLNIFVTNTRTASKSRVKSIQNIVEENTIKGSVFVLNGIKMNRFQYYYSRYVYGNYGYGYGYGGYGRYGVYGANPTGQKEEGA